MLEQRGPVTQKLINFQRNYEAEKSNPPKYNGEFQLTTEAFFNRIKQHEQSTFNKYRSGVSSVRQEVLNLESDINLKEKYIFYPRSNHYDDKVKKRAMEERALAVQKMQGSVNTTGLINEIENNFQSGNNDVNAEYYHYLLSHNLPGVSMDNQLSIINKLKAGFGKGIDDLKQLKADLKTAKQELKTVESTFKVS